MVEAAQAQGEYYDLLRKLNAAAGQTRFALRFQPRARLERDLKAGQLRGAILGVNPVWFNDAERQRYYWTDPIFHDRDLVISRRNDPFQYGQDSLVGRTVCYVRGYFYDGITQWVRSGDLTLFPVPKEDVIFHSLDQSRCDFGIISESMYAYLRQTGEVVNEYFIADQPQAEYDRMILVPLNQPALFHELQQYLQHIKTPDVKRVTP